ncbi:MAG: NAD-binding protein [Actinobacteria bacterium]|nr:NAD-binding protein [Actinomycetota bacterium]
MNIIIAGGGKVGFYLAKELSSKGHNVSLIERREDRAKKIALQLNNVLVIKGDACDAEYLEQAGIEDADIVIAATGDDDDNLVISQLAKATFNVKKVIARVNNPKNEKIFKVLNVDVPVASTSIIVKVVEEEASAGELVTIMPIGEGHFRLVEIQVPDNSRVNGKKVEELSLPKDCIFVAIEKKDGVVIPRGSTVIESGDRIYAITTPEREKILIDVIRGKIEKEACEL